MGYPSYFLKRDTIPDCTAAGPTLSLIDRFATFRCDVPTSTDITPPLQQHVKGMSTTLNVQDEQREIRANTGIFEPSTPPKTRLGLLSITITVSFDQITCRCVPTAASKACLPQT